MTCLHNSLLARCLKTEPSLLGLEFDCDLHRTKSITHNQQEDNFKTTDWATLWMCFYLESSSCRQSITSYQHHQSHSIEPITHQLSALLPSQAAAICLKEQRVKEELKCLLEPCFLCVLIFTHWTEQRRRCTVTGCCSRTGRNETNMEYKWQQDKPCFLGLEYRNIYAKRCYHDVQ